MKKYLMSGIAAFAIAAAFTSCSKSTDLYEEGRKEKDQQEQKAKTTVENFKEVFVETFGTPDPNHQWGFDTPAATRAATRAVSFAYYDFPDDAETTKFLADAPAGVEKLTANAGSTNNWIDETWQGEINIWGAWDGSKTSGGTLYIKGNCDFSNRKFYFAGNSELYLLEGATLTLNAENAANLQTNTMIYMAANSKIITTGELKLNNGLHIYNHGTIEANKLSTNSNSLLYNVGTVTVTTKISVENDLSAIVNDGTITAADLNTAGSGKFENNGNTIISGTTFVNSNNNTWVNNGQYRTGNFIYNAASDEVINNCRLTVDEDFNINLGDNPGNGNFKMNTNSGVVTKYFNGGGNWAKNYSTGWSSFNGGPFYVFMGANSVFKVTETATMNATKADYGFYGPDDGYAVLDAKKIVNGAANQGYEVTYGGNLYVYAAEGHFANGYSGQYPYIDIKDNAKIFATGFNDGKPTIKIKETECNPGFEGEEEKYDGRIMAEDLNASESSDFDYNDVVFDYKIEGNRAKIQLRAAGGIYPLTVGGQEVHAKFGFPDTYPMINTGAGPTATAEPYYYDFPNGVDATAINIPVIVTKDGVPYTLGAPTGDAAAKFCVVTTCKWMKEYKFISDAYSLFDDWVKDRSVKWTTTIKDASLIYNE